MSRWSAMLRLCALALWLVACGDGNEKPDFAVPPDMAVAPDLSAPATCPRDLPASCPPTDAGVPSYAGDIAPLMQKYCVPCHMAGGLASDRLLGDYPDLFSQRAAVLDQVYSCFMPPPDAGQPTESERVALLQWLVCHAPNN